MCRFIFMVWALAQAGVAFAENPRVLADFNFLQAMGIQPQIADKELNLAIAEVSEYQLSALPHFAHKFKKCGGFELLGGLKRNNSVNSSESTADINSYFSAIKKLNILNHQYELFSARMLTVPVKENIQAAVNQVNVDNIRATVQWLSSYPSRFHKSENGKKAIADLYQKLSTEILNTGRTDIKLDLVSHLRTPQQSLRVHIEGKSHPQEIVVLGAHFDSINSRMTGGSAPGADDNASGSANLIETLRLLLTQAQPDRSVEFFWYAGEEAGLLGSAEIASQYNSEGKQVIGVMQLDMTAFAGEGETVIGEMTDFTSTWLRDYLRDLSQNYLPGVTWVQDKCGYGCSDHASWYRNGFPTVIPFEARMNTMNKNLHTSNDIVSVGYNFNHSAIFSKLATAFVLDLSNSDLHQPY